MTRFAEPSFSVAAPTTEAYASNHARIFGERDADKLCTACAGKGCASCHQTGRRAWQEENR